MTQYLWGSPWIFWPLTVATYVSIGLVFGLIVYYRWKRHVYLYHKTKDETTLCWCSPGWEINPGACWVFGAATSPFFWPVYIVGILVYRLVICPVVFVIRVIMRLYERVGQLAHWDGKTIEGAHPTAKPVNKHETFYE